MPLDFLDKGEYAVTLGKSFDNDLRKSSRQYLAIKKNKGSQFDGYTKHAVLEKERENDKYNLEMKSSDGQNVAFDADMEPEEYQCVVIYNHDTKLKSFRIERIGAVINLSRKNTEEIEEGAIIESPIVDRRQEIEQPIASTADGTDDFDFDITKDMDEILGDDEDEEDEDEDVEMTAVPIEVTSTNNNAAPSNNNSSESEFEEDIFEEVSTAPIALPPSYSSHGESASPMSLPVTPSLPQVVASPSLPANLQLPGTPIASSSTAAAAAASATPPANSSTPTKKRKFKMASAPIRHPGTLSPMVAPPLPPAQPAQPASRPEPKRYKSEDEDDSSSGSEESSSGSESGSTETDSSSSGETESESGSSDDEIFENLVQDISMSLSKDGPSAPASPQLGPSSSNGMSVPSPSTFGKSPYSSVNTPTPTRNVSGNTGAGPMSLRALFKEDDEEEDLSSSSSDND